MKLAKSNQFNRSGFVQYRMDHHENGAMSLMLAVDYERAPVPDNNYVADFFEVVRADADVVLVFGKVDLPRGDRLRNKMEIYFPFDLFVRQLWKSSRAFQETLRETLKKKNAAEKLPGGVPSDTDKVQTLTSNNVLMVMAAGQCVMDFFLISTKDLWVRAKKGEAIGADALVRVFVSDKLLLGFLNQCDRIAKELIEELGISLGEDEDEALEPIDL